MAKWYSVKDKLPKKGQDVLVIAVNSAADESPPHFFDRFISLARYTGDKSFGIREFCYPHGAEVTHWQTMPKLPRAKMKLPDWLKFILMVVGCTLALGLANYISHGGRIPTEAPAYVESP